MPARFLPLEQREHLRRHNQLVEIYDYPYSPAPRTWPASPLWRLIDQGADDYAEILKFLVSLNDDFRRIPIFPDPTNEASPAWDNTWLPGLDAVSLYGMVAKHKPRRYVEVGSGNSTKFVRRAISEHSPATKLISIGPGPTTAVEEICDQSIRLPLENAPLDVFSEVEAGDIVFIDNSHRAFQNSDVTVVFTEVIPRLAPGVIYALHDIFLPWDYPADWDWRFYNEQYMLMAYLLGGGGGDRILFPTHYVSRMERYIAMRGSLFLGAQNLAHLNCSFWLVRGGNTA